MKAVVLGVGKVEGETAAAVMAAAVMVEGAWAVEMEVVMVAGMEKCQAFAQSELVLCPARRSVASATGRQLRVGVGTSWLQPTACLGKHVRALLLDSSSAQIGDFR